MKYCLIGKKLGHSYSREIHQEKGLDYALVEVAENDLAKFFKNNEYNGFNVTIPYKKDVIPYMSEVSAVAKLAGAVNTVVNKNGKFYGYNTDVDGMKYMLSRKGVTLKDKSVLILGSGGTSNTAKTLCQIENAKTVRVVSRTGEINYDNCYNYQDVEIIINTTPVGMFPNVDCKPIECGNFKNLIAVFDCIYNPFLTELLSDAKRLGVIYSDGLPMLVKQALLAEEIWLENVIDDSETEKIISKLRIQKSNIVLYGMPSSGKSTLGKKIAKILDREFIDTDEYILKITGKTPSNIINESGIDEFRNIESQAVKEVAKLSGKVIALGGGAVLRSENVTALKRNGVLVYVKRNLELLSVKGRPLSQTIGVEKLYEQRKDIYENIKDCVIENNGKLNVAVNGVILEYENTCNKWC